MTAPDPVTDVLTGLGPDEYGDAHVEHCLEIYKLYVEMADRISSRRQHANSFFLSINSVLIAGFSYGQFKDIPTVLLLVLTATGITSCVLWWHTINASKNLNSAKFHIVALIEKQLPLRPYKAEWRRVGQGTLPFLYRPLTHIERWIPITFCVLYVALIATLFIPSLTPDVSVTNTSNISIPTSPQ